MIAVVVLQLYTFVKAHQSVLLKLVNFIVCKWDTKETYFFDGGQHDRGYGNISIVHAQKVIKIGSPTLLILPQFSFSVQGGVCKWKRKPHSGTINEQQDLWHGDCTRPFMYFPLQLSAMQWAFKCLSGFTYLPTVTNKMTQIIMLPRVSTALMHFLRIVNPILSNCAPKRNSDKTWRAQIVTYISLPYRNKKIYLNLV